MMTRNISVLAWTAAAAALASWAGVFTYGSWISSQRVENLSQATNARSVFEREIEAERVRALSSDTKNLRAELDSLTRPDVISVADTIDSIGKTAGVKLKIGAVASEPTAQKKKSGSVSLLHTVDFIVETEGTFSSIMRVAELLETLPVLSAVQSLEFQHIESLASSKIEKPDNWHLNARVRVFTATDISS